MLSQSYFYCVTIDRLRLSAQNNNNILIQEGS